MSSHSIVKPSKERMLSILLAPHVSEKTARAAQDGNQVVFRVRRDAKKPEIKAAVEMLFDVKVSGVNVVNAEGKQKRFGQRLGWRQDYKKAYVRLAPGQTIEFTGTEA